MVNCYTLTTRPLILVLGPFFVLMASAIEVPVGPVQSPELPGVLVPGNFGALSTTSPGTSTAEHTKKEDLAVVTRRSSLTMTWWRNIEPPCLIWLSFVPGQTRSNADPVASATTM